MMQIGIHLPQYGRAASPDLITEAAAQAERLGFSSIWVSDHVAVPESAAYPPPFLYDPLITLTWAAAATSSVLLGTSVLLLALRHAPQLAKELASLDQVSRGRLVLGAGTGWLESEFETVGVPFIGRGRRTDDGIGALRACWGQRVVNYESPTVTIRGMRIEPKPCHPIPIWCGGTSPAAVARAIRLGDGWHAIGLEPAEMQPVIRNIRSKRPDESFVVSTRLTWDGLTGNLTEYRHQLAAYEASGVQHVVLAPSQIDANRWLESVEALAHGLHIADDGEK